jgi:hypothetical protein
MARYRRKKALYEVIGKARLKSSYGKTSEQLHSEKYDKNQADAVDSTQQLPKRMTGWPKRPRMMQFNAGRIEISIPYQLAVALLLGIVLLFLVVFRLGQNVSLPRGPKATGLVEKMQKSPQKAASQPTTGQTQMPETKTLLAAKPDEKADLADSKAGNRIVIQTYQLKTHLEPVSQYFAQFGIETEIKKIDDWYYLVTKEKYENPERPGTDGYRAKQRIIDLGAKYKAPPGYETFGTKPFYDAYGKKFDD